MARDRSPLVDLADSKELVPAERQSELMSPIEPERTLNDWGRSERVEGFMDQTLFEFFYRYWFRGRGRGHRERAGRWAALSSSRTTLARSLPTPG